MRILRAAFAADERPPDTLSVWITAQLGPATKVTLDLDSDYKSDNTDLYAWSITTGDTIDIKAGQNFTVIVEGDVNVDAPRSNVWKRWLGHELPTIGDVGDVAERQKIRDAINTETKLRAGTGIEIGIPNQEGKRTVAVANPKGIDSRALGAADAFAQRTLDQKKPWRVEAIEQGVPVVVKLTREPNSSVYKKVNIPIDDTVMVTIQYTRLPTPNSSAPLPDRGKFIITAEPISTARDLHNLFPNGTVTHFTVRLGTTKDEAKLGQLLRLPVEEVGTDTLEMRTKRALVSDEERPLAEGHVYAQVNFVVRGNWRREPESDLTGTGFEIGDITSDGTSLLAVNRDTFEVAAFTNGKKDPLKGLAADTVRAEIVGTYAVGLTTDGTNLYVLSDYRRLVAFTPNGERVAEEVTPERGRSTSALTYDGSHLLVGGIRNLDNQELPRVRPFTTDLVMKHGLPLHLGGKLVGVNSGLKIGGLAFDNGVLYVGDSSTGRVHAFFEDGSRDETKEPPESMTVSNMKGMTVHNGRLYIAVGHAALAFVIPRDRYAFTEGYHYTALDQDGLRNAVNSAPEVAQLPRAPVPGQRVKLTATDHLEAYPNKLIERDDYTWDGQWMLTPGLRRVHDGGITGIEITDTSAVRKQGPFTRFLPSFDLDLIADGALSSQLELEIKSRSLITIGFDGHPTATYREGAMATVGAIKRQAAYPSGAVEGVVVAATPIYNGADKLGTLRLYLAANASHALGYRLDYATNDRSVIGKELTVGAELALIYQPFLQ